MRRAVAVVVSVLVVVGLAWELIPIQVIIWDGSIELTVSVVSSGSPPRSVSCEASSSREYAEWAIANLVPPEKQAWPIVFDPFDGQPLKVRVPISGRSSPLGRELKRYQFRYLVVIAVLEDGSRVGKLVDIPDVRVSREVSVTLQ